MTRPDIAFLGTGANFMFSLGVAKYLAEHHSPIPTTTVLSASGGGIGAVAYLTLAPEEFDLKAHELAQLFHTLYQNPLFLFSIPGTFKQALELFVTPERLTQLQNRLQIVTTTLPFFQRKIHNRQFESVHDTIRSLQASAYIPFYFLRGPYLDHLFEVDGGLKIQPSDFPDTLTISPHYKHQTDVYLSRQKLPVYRIRPYHEHLELYTQGYQRACDEARVIARKLQWSTNI